MLTWQPNVIHTLGSNNKKQSTPWFPIPCSRSDRNYATAACPRTQPHRPHWLPLPPPEARPPTSLDDVDALSRRALLQPDDVAVDVLSRHAQMMALSALSDQLPLSSVATGSTKGRCCSHGHVGAGVGAPLLEEVEVGRERFFCGGARAAPSSSSSSSVKEGDRNGLSSRWSLLHPPPPPSPSTTSEEELRFGSQRVLHIAAAPAGQCLKNAHTPAASSPSAMVVAVCDADEGAAVPTGQQG